MGSVSRGFKLLAIVTLVTGLTVLSAAVLDRPAEVASRSTSLLSAETATPTLAPYPLPGTPQGPAKAQAMSTPTLNPYPMPPTPTATPLRLPTELALVNLLMLSAAQACGKSPNSCPLKQGNFL